MSVLLFALYCPALPCTQAVNNGDQLQINPGSATGAYSTFSDTVQPSFVLMDLDGSKVGGPVLSADTGWGRQGVLRQCHALCRGKAGDFI